MILIIITSTISQELAKIPPAILKPFATVPDSMFILFKIMNGAQSDDESAAIDALMTKLPAMKFAFVFFMIASSWTLLSILTAVVSENMISTTSMQEETFRLESAEKDREDHIKALKEIFQEMDKDGNGSCTKEEVHEFLSDPQQALECARCVRVPTREIKEVINMVSRGKEAVDMTEFVECLTTVGKTATEKSVMKLVFEMQQLEANLNDNRASAVLALRDGQRAWQDAQTARMQQLEANLTATHRTSSRSSTAVLELREAQRAWQEELSRGQEEQARMLRQLVTGTGAVAAGTPRRDADELASQASPKDAERLLRQLDARMYQLEASTTAALLELRDSHRIAQEEQVRRQEEMARRQEEQAGMLRQLLSGGPGSPFGAEEGTARSPSDGGYGRSPRHAISFCTSCLHTCVQELAATLWGKVDSRSMDLCSQACHKQPTMVFRC